MRSTATRLRERHPSCLRDAPSRVVTVVTDANSALLSLVSKHALTAMTARALDGGAREHLVIDDFLQPDIARDALSEIDRFPGRWSYRRHQGQRKRNVTDLGAMPGLVRRIFGTLNNEACCQAMELVDGVDRLVSDPDLDGSGLYEMRPGDFMRPHRDSVGHVTQRHWRRRQALFIFLNPDWKEDYGGALTLWDRRTQAHVSILPAFNRCVLFSNPSAVRHGVTDIRCPTGGARRSLVMYYYSKEAEPLPLVPTTYDRSGDITAARGTSQSMF